MSPAHAFAWPGWAATPPMTSAARMEQPSTNRRIFPSTNVDEEETPHTNQRFHAARRPRPAGRMRYAPITNAGARGMATLTLKNVPDHLYEELKRAAARSRRSLNQESIERLQKSLATDLDAEALRRRLVEFSASLSP